MSSFLFSALNYFKYIVKRKDEHSLHSPFLFDFYTKTVLVKDSFEREEIEKMRQQLLKSNVVLNKLDLGAGSRKGSKLKTIDTIAKESLTPKKQNVFFSAVVNYLKAQKLLELGTSFGINGVYLASSLSNVQLVTIEGDPAVAEKARQLFEELGVSTITLLVGGFDEKLPGVLAESSHLDLVFFDGNHRYEPTLRYFNACLAKTHSLSVFIFHDIYWSKEMTLAWKEIISREEVTISLDFYYFGIVFFRDNQPKQHHVLKF